MQTYEQIYYFTDEAELKYEEAIKADLEEKRLQEERIAEARRLLEIEKQKRQILSICDY